MDVSEYKDEFVSEARDHMDTLNEALLVLEKDSSDEENINKLFRAFHTLKGNSAAMGFVKFSELAHALEDVLSKVRDKELSVSQEVMDLLFDGCDILEEGLDKISNNDPDGFEVEDMIGSLKELLGQTEESYDVSVSESVELNDDEQKMIDSLLKKKMSAHRIILVFDPSNFLKAAKASVLLRDLAEISEIIKTTPSQDDIKQGKFEAEVEFIIASKEPKEKISDMVEKLSGTKKTLFLSLDEKYQKDKSDDKKEEAKDDIVKKHKRSVVKQIQSVKVDMEKLDKLMNLVGELLISNIRMQSINKRHKITELKTVLAGIDRLTTDLQEEVMGVRMLPIGNIFNRFPRMVRDLATKENKQINFVIEGQEIEFDRTVLDEIGDPLVHLLRNSIDHGIEDSETRINNGKPQEGTVKLIARRDKNHAVIDIIDDGQGIDSEAVKKSCISKGAITEDEASKMSKEELQMLIFRAGVSTNKVVTEVSGRGVGMDVVESKIKELGGVVRLNSEIGKGTTISLRLPLTVAIISVLMVKVNEKIYAIPLTNIDETVDVHLDDLKTIKGHDVFIMRGIELPLFWMHNLVGITDFEKKKNLTVVIINYNDEKLGIVVDEIESQQQILIKSLPNVVKGTKGISGATILGDGSVALILDINSIFENT